jgi:serine protease Do
MKKIGLIAGISFLAGAIFFALTFGFFQETTDKQIELKPSITKANTETTTTIEHPQPKSQNTERIGSALNFAPLVKKLKAAVVKVEAEAKPRRSSSRGDFFDRFFRNDRERVSGTGSGFFISNDGYILTNNHVVADADKIKITDINKNAFDARRIGSDPKTDLALLKIDVKDVPFIQLGDSEALEVGEWVLAIGNPLGQDLSVTSGIVSAKGRQLSGLAEVDYQDFIQTDAAINHGNSGGPLINMEGKAVGITSVILSTSGGSIGIGFAIPSNMARSVLADLKTEGRVIRGYLGIGITEVLDSEAEQYDMPMGGVLIGSVEKNTPANNAGLEKWDLITEVNGKRVRSSMDLRNIIASHKPGDEVSLTIYRGQKKMTFKVKVTEAPDSVKIKSDGDNGQIIDLGMQLRENSSGIAKEYNLPTSKGIVITDVERGGIAHQNGLQPGDIIIGINRTEIESLRQFRRIISQKSGSKVLLAIIRKDDELLIRFSIPN